MQLQRALSDFTALNPINPMNNYNKLICIHWNLNHHWNQHKSGVLVGQIGCTAIRFHITQPNVGGGNRVIWVVFIIVPDGRMFLKSIGWGKVFLQGACSPPNVVVVICTRWRIFLSSRVVLVQGACPPPNPKAEEPQSLPKRLSHLNVPHTPDSRASASSPIMYTC